MSDEGLGSAADQRQHPRFRVNLTIHIRLSSGELVSGVAVNISKGGLYIEYGAPADPDDEFEMLFDLPFENDFRRVYARAKVIRSVIIGGKDVYGIAFAFTSFAKDTEEVLEQYLDYRSVQQGI